MNKQIEPCLNKVESIQKKKVYTVQESNASTILKLGFVFRRRSLDHP